MSGLNKVMLIGRLGQNPELRTTQSGMSVCNFSIATSESFLKDGKKEDKTEWHKIILFAKQAENANKFLSKGKLVYIEGKIQTRKWVDKDGAQRSSTEIVGNLVQFLEPKDNSQGQKPSDVDEYYRGSETVLSVVENDDIPF